MEPEALSAMHDDPIGPRSPISTEDGVGGEESASPDGRKKRERERSKIEFPYNDLSDAITIVRTIHRQSGDWCGPDQLASWMGHESVGSGTFRTKLSAARIFGLAEVTRDRVSLTRLGQQILDPDQERAARVRAFLNVPLYRQLYDNFKGRVLPPDPGLEQVMVSYGVAAKQKDKARQTFQRSAEQSGMFYQGRNRLVLPPGISDHPDAQETNGSSPDIESTGLDNRPINPEPKRVQDFAFDGGSNQQISTHILIHGLFQALPPAGQSWSQSARDAWVTLAQSIFDVVYKKDPEI